MLNDQHLRAKTVLLFQPLTFVSIAIIHAQESLFFIDQKLT